MTHDRAWLERLLEVGQQSLLRVKDTPSPNQQLLLDLEAFCTDLQRRLEELAQQQR